MATRPRALVLGEIDLVHAVAAARIPLDVVAAPGQPARYTRHRGTVIGWRDPASDGDALVERLLAHARRQHARPVLLYDGDWDVLLVSRRREQLREALDFVVADEELVEDLLDKGRFAALAERIGLPVPPGRVLRPAQDDVGEALALGLPLVLKPLTREHASWRPVERAKVASAATEQELRALWARLGARGITVLAQPLIAGGEERVESYHVYVDAEGAVAGEFTGRKVRTHPRTHGYTTALELTAAGDVAELGRELVARIGLRGVAKLDFKRAPDGALHLLEVNPRFNLWHLPGAAAGVNLPELVYRDLAGLPRPPARRARPGVRWVALRDVQPARAAGLSLAAWLRYFASAETRHGVALGDPLPLLAAAAGRVLHR